MTWRSFKCSEASAINIPGYRKRAYCGSGGTKIYNESTDDYSKYSPVFVIYKNKNNMMDDVLTEFHIHNSKSNTTTPIPRNIIERYLKLYPELSLVDIDGRFFIKGMDAYSRFEFAFYNFDELLWQFLYPKVNSIDSAHEVVDAYYNFITKIHYLKEDRFTSIKLNLMDKIKEERQKIEEQMSLIEDCAIRSADALNELSEKYGIEVEL